ncbi:MAG: MBL fold metallo-hydrolase [Chloroflexi bacterium RBG_19FT_COMBO_50_10]|nr:MAG: MBL fold metallo-hydrolase [Chloroflexi bacterium RBG_19FT_COMBO_50_10]
MREHSPITIVNVGYLSTNYWVVSTGRSRLLVDLGYPGTMGTMRARLTQMDIPLKEIRYALATHYHIDHAGLAQELKMAGVQLLVVDVQVAAIPLMKRFTKPQDHYVDILLDGNVVISASESRALLEGIGIPGEILPTPGHSDDSLSLLLDDGSVFTGDLTPLEHAWGEAEELVKSSWQLLKEKGARRVYPAHGPVQAIPSISGLED